MKRWWQSVLRAVRARKVYHARGRYHLRRTRA